MVDDGWGPHMIGQFPMHMHAMALKWSCKKFKHDGPKRPDLKAGTDKVMSDLNFEW